MSTNSDNIENQNSQIFLDDDLGRAAFGSFLRKEFSEENLMFWEDCTKLEQLDDEEEISIQINDIIFKYIG